MRQIDDWLAGYDVAMSLDISRDLALSHAEDGGFVGRKIAALIRGSKANNFAGDIRAICEFELPSYESLDWVSVEEIEQAIRGGDPALERWYFSDELVNSFLEPEEISELESMHARVVEAIKIRNIRNCRQALAFFQKLEHLEIGIDRKEVAFEKFLEAEEACWETNRIFRKARKGEEFTFLPHVAGVLHTAKERIARVLGGLPDIRKLNLRFGPGATTGVRKKEACSRTKLSEGLACSEDLISAVPYLLGELPYLVALHQDEEFIDMYEDYWDVMASVGVSIQDSRLSFVPKNYKTYRSICVEPSLNVIYQAGLGEHVAMRLRKFGVDIRDQTRNQRLAREGSLTGALATLDLSMASDTVATELVAELLPPDWFETLRRARTGKVKCMDPVTKKGYRIVQEKFSSMGNGFTFPLETLIFWGLASAATTHAGGSQAQVSVYGDDIIVPVKAYSLLSEVLTTCGLQVNHGKSYKSGFFRESCGTDWYRGIDVRPTYPKEWWSPRTLFVLHNYYVREGDASRAKRVESIIHPALRIYGPDGYGDGHLLGDHDRTPDPRYVARGFGGYAFKTFKQRAMKHDKSAEPAVEEAVALYASYQSGSAERRIEIGAGDCPYLVALQKRFDRGHGNFGESALPIPSKDDVKVLTLPGTEGYQKVSIYTFGD